MKRYPEYKDSGAPWLGQVPAHWELGRLGSYVSLRGEKGSDKEFEPLSVTKQGVVPQLETAAKTDDGDNRKVVRRGDLAINGRSDRKGSSGLSEMDGSVSLINIVLKIDRGIHPKFAHHLIRSVAFQEEFYRWGRGIVADLWSTNYWDLKRIPTALPPLDEQRKIAEFVDATIGQMNSAISSQERMIELLKERRSAIITQAVTKGLDPNAKLKDSGVPWLGQVPAHWEVKPLKFVAKYNLNTLPETIDPNTEINYIEVSDVSQELGIKSFECMRFADAPSRARRVVARGEVIISTVRTYLKAIARVDHVHDQFVCSTGFCVVRPDSVMADFAQYALASDFFMAEVISRSTGVSYPAINASDLVRVKIAVPPVDEQAKIGSYLARAVAELDSAINSQAKMIELLKERRSAIITQAVTGQIDVR